MKDFEPETFAGYRPGHSRGSRFSVGEWKPYVYRGDQRDQEFSTRCGTLGGYNFHLYKGEKPDHECLAAYLEHEREKKKLARIDEMIEQAHKRERTEARKQAPSYPYRKAG